jgi:hypothetical protein
MPSNGEIRNAQRATWAGLSAGWEKWDAVARAVLGDDQRARLARSRSASARRRTGAAADSGTRYCEGEGVREGG